MGIWLLIGRPIGAVSAAFGFFLLLACGPETLPPQGISHPGGAQSLHASQIDPDDLLVRGRVYVPVYSIIHWSELRTRAELSATVSVRNADAEHSLVLTSVTYYDSVGKPIQEYIDGVKELDPLATIEFIIERSDTRGGSGAKFIVNWGSPGPIAEPVMEAIMLGQFGNSRFSFVSPGRPIRVLKPDPDSP